MKTCYIPFDPRSKLATVFFASLLLMFRVNWLVETIFVLLMLIVLILNGGWKKGIILSGLYVLMLSFEQVYLTQILGPIKPKLNTV